MTERPKFLSDVDGCTADLMGGFSSWTLNRFGVWIDVNKIVFHNDMGRSPGLAEADLALKTWFPDGIEGTFNCFMKDRDVYGKFIQPVEGSVDAVARIKRMGYEVVFVTALMKSARDHFRSKMEWIERWFPECQVMTVPSGLKHLVSGRFVVEDRYDTAQRWLDADVGVEEAYLFKQPWNELPDTPYLGWTPMRWVEIVQNVEEYDHES